MPHSTAIGLPCGQDDMQYVDVGLLASILTNFNLLLVNFHGPRDRNVVMNSHLYHLSGVDNTMDGCLHVFFLQPQLLR